MWADNAATAEGHLLHERVGAGMGETRPGIRIARGLHLRSFALGVTGRADAAEFCGSPHVPYPVEYKLGRPKPHRADEVQLSGAAAQAAPDLAVARRAIRCGAAMKKLLNTIYVMTEGAWLRKDGANLVVEVDGSERGRAPLHMLDGVVSFGRAGASPSLMAACAEAGITISFVDPVGRFLARVEGQRSGNVLRRRTQYRVADDPSRKTPIVRAMVIAKTANQRAVVRRALRDHGDSTAVESTRALAAAETRLTDIGRRALVTDDINGLRGLEGEAGSTYFSIFAMLVRVEDAAFVFIGRSRRPPLDRVNALLGFLYALLGHDCRSALEMHGLDPQVGFLHTDRPGRTSLALDLMEEIDPTADSLRFYRLGADGKRRVEHVGAKPNLDLEGPLIF